MKHMESRVTTQDQNSFSLKQQESIMCGHKEPKSVLHETAEIRDIYIES